MYKLKELIINEVKWYARGENFLIVYVVLKKKEPRL